MCIFHIKHIQYKHMMYNALYLVATVELEGLTQRTLYVILHHDLEISLQNQKVYGCVYVYLYLDVCIMCVCVYMSIVDLAAFSGAFKLVSKTPCCKH